MDCLFTDARPILCASTNNTFVYRESFTLQVQFNRECILCSQSDECMVRCVASLLVNWNH
jgi:hypothetical protein